MINLIRELNDYGGLFKGLDQNLMGLILDILEPFMVNLMFTSGFLFLYNITIQKLLLLAPEIM